MAIDLSTRKSDGGAMNTTTDRPAAETLGRCNACKRTFDPYVRSAEGYVIHEDGTVRTPGSIPARVRMVGDQTAACPACGHESRGPGWPWWAFTTITGRFGRTACDDLCTTATGSTCRCSCGGWAHGSRA